MHAVPADCACPLSDVRPPKARRRCSSACMLFYYCRIRSRANGPRENGGGSGIRGSWPQSDSRCAAFFRVVSPGERAVLAGAFSAPPLSATSAKTIGISRTAYRRKPQSAANPTIKCPPRATCSGDTSVSLRPARQGERAMLG